MKLFGLFLYCERQIIDPCIKNHLPICNLFQNNNYHFFYLLFFFLHNVVSYKQAEITECTSYIYFDRNMYVYLFLINNILVFER